MELKDGYVPSKVVQSVWDYQEI